MLRLDTSMGIPAIILLSMVVVSFPTLISTIYDSKEIMQCKGPLSDLRKFWAIESPLKMMINAFYFMLKALFVIKIFTFLSWLCGYVEKQLDKKVMVNFKIYDVRVDNK